MRGLVYLSIVNCTARGNGWTDFPVYFDNGLQKIVVSGCGLDNKAADYILEAVLGSSIKTLIHLNLSHNALTRIPPMLKYFVNIRHVSIHNQREPGFGHLSSLAISSKAPIEKIDLKFCNITDIQPGAIQGLFYSLAAIAII